MQRLVVCLMTILLPLGSSCRGRDPAIVGEGEVEPAGFSDHTFDALATTDDFLAIAKSTSVMAAVKVVITRFMEPGARVDGAPAGAGAQVRFLDAAFYALHDEWYWYRLLNGAAISGLTSPQDRPLITSHGPFAAIADVYAWASLEIAAGRTLPLDLRFLSDGERLYSPRFYDLALFNVPRSLGVATVLRFPETDARAAVWAVEPEFSDPAPEDVVRAFLDSVEAQLPAEVQGELRFIVRSQAQAQTAQGFSDALRARVITFDDVVTPGLTEVYSTGTVAGRALLVRRGEEALLRTSRATDVLIVEEVPDALPPCAALITAQPQTALAHVNLLARNRGIPNAFRQGVADDPNVDQLARARAPVVVRADAQGNLVIRAISDADFATWRSLTQPQTIAPAEVDLDGVPHTMGLAGLTIADMADARPQIGGKATGFVALLDAGVSTVDAPLAVTIKPYALHLDSAGLTALLPAILDDRAFAGDAVIRRLVLEGDGAIDASVAASFRDARPPGTLLRDIVDRGGVAGAIENTPLTAEVREAIGTALAEHFGRYAKTQGLRFRSSSTIEDAEGFNGAGLYESHTGYLDASAGTSWETALRRTWASYWKSEAFEERRLANAVHLAGNMAVVVHANFPDSTEVNNGVALFSIMPSRAQGDARPSGYVLEVNQQQGAVSVTNPVPGSPHLPEIDRVVEDEHGVVRIERVRQSTLMLPGANVLDDDALLAMFDDAKAITEAWLSGDNATVASSARRSTLTLDFETRTVRAGWPALRSGVSLPQRLVWKQARPLEPAARVPEAVANLPIPADVLARARRVFRRHCQGTGMAVTATLIETDAAMSPDMGYSVAPFVSFIFVDAGVRRSAIHTAYASVTHDDGITIDIEASRHDVIGLVQVTVGEALRVITPTETVSGAASCADEDLFASPAAFLDGLLQ